MNSSSSGCSASISLSFRQIVIRCVILPGRREILSRATLEVRPGDLVVLVTDGVTEPLGHTWVDIVKAVRQTDPIAVAVRMLLDAAGTTPAPDDLGDVDWQDDRTVVAVRISALTR